MRISRRFALLAVFAGLFIPESVRAADIYTVTATLDPGEAFAKIKRLATGKYKLQSDSHLRQRE